MYTDFRKLKVIYDNPIKLIKFMEKNVKCNFFYSNRNTYVGLCRAQELYLPEFILLYVRNNSNKETKKVVYISDYVKIAV